MVPMRKIEELKLRIPTNIHVGFIVEFIASVLQKCPGVVKLLLRMTWCVEVSDLWCLLKSFRSTLRIRLSNGNG
jgi:hypothetical protein